MKETKLNTGTWTSLGSSRRTLGSIWERDKSFWCFSMISTSFSCLPETHSLGIISKHLCASEGHHHPRPSRPPYFHLCLHLKISISKIDIKRLPLLTTRERKLSIGPLLSLASSSSLLTVRPTPLKSSGTMLSGRTSFMEASKIFMLTNRRN